MFIHKTLIMRKSIIKKYYIMYIFPKSLSNVTLTTESIRQKENKALASYTFFHFRGNYTSNKICV